jgi:hypothetical protein
MPYVIKTSAAKMPTSCRQPYIRIAVLEIEDGAQEPTMISTRARGVIRIVQTWGPVPRKGTTARSGKALAMAAAVALVDSLNAA